MAKALTIKIMAHYSSHSHIAVSNSLQEFIMDAYPWSPCYGWTADRFGVSWQVVALAPKCSTFP